MFNECELYYYEGLYFNEEEINKLNIQKTDCIGLITLLQNYINVCEMNNCEMKQLNKEMLQDSALKDKKEFYFIIRDNNLIILPMKVYYGIKGGHQVLAFWDDKKIRDAKLVDVKKNGIAHIISDMASSQSLIDSYQKQIKMKKVYTYLDNGN